MAGLNRPRRRSEHVGLADSVAVSSKHWRPRAHSSKIGGTMAMSRCVLSGLLMLLMPPSRIHTSLCRSKTNAH
jgi:hypothetical protein